MWLRHPINSYAFSSISKLSCNLSRHGQLWESEEDASLKRELMSAAVHLSDKSFRGFVKSYFGLDPFQQLADMLSNNKDEKLIRKVQKLILTKWLRVIFKS